MKKGILFISAVILILIVYSCEENIELDIPDQIPKMVVQGVLTPDENAVFDLRRSFTVKDRNADASMKFQQIDNPKFQLFKGSQLIGNLNVSPANYFIYSINYSDFQAGEKYTLIGNANGYPSIQSETIIPDKPVVHISDFNYTMPDVNQISFNLNVNINDKENKENYYQILLYARNPYSFNYYYEDNNEISPDPSVQMINGIYFINDKLFDGKTKTISIKNNYYSQIITTQQTDTFWVDCYAITKDYYDYMITSHRQDYNDFDIFAEPILIKHNINGGYGVFGAANKKRTAMIIHSKK